MHGCSAVLGPTAPDRHTLYAGNQSPRMQQPTTQRVPATLFMRVGHRHHCLQRNHTNCIGLPSPIPLL